MRPEVRRRRMPLASPVAGDPDRTIDLVVWQGPDQPDQEAPLVIYSHGQAGRAAEARDLGRALAARGCMVAAPEHRDERSAPASAGADVRARYAHRLGDLRCTLDHLAPGEPARPVLLIGYSLGAYPALVLAGLPPGPADRRVRGLVLLSPAVFMFEDDAFDALAVPSLSLYGEEERSVVRGGVGRWDRARRIGARLGARGELVEVPGAGHLALVRRRPLRDVLPSARHCRRRVARRVVEFVERVAGTGERVMRSPL